MSVWVNGSAKQSRSAYPTRPKTALYRITSSIYVATCQIYTFNYRMRITLAPKIQFLGLQGSVERCAISCAPNVTEPLPAIHCRRCLMRRSHRSLFMTISFACFKERAPRSSLRSRNASVFVKNLCYKRLSRTLMAFDCRLVDPREIRRARCGFTRSR